MRGNDSIEFLIWVGIVFLLVTPIFWIIGIISFKSMKRWLSTAVKTTGKVVGNLPVYVRRNIEDSNKTLYNQLNDNKEYDPDTHQKQYYVQVEYIHPEAGDIVFESSFSTSRPYEEGKEVGVWYQSENPHDCKIADWKSLYLVSNVMLFMSVIFTFVATMMIVIPIIILR